MDKLNIALKYQVNDINSVVVTWATVQFKLYNITICTISSNLLVYFKIFVGYPNLEILNNWQWKGIHQIQNDVEVCHFFKNLFHSVIITCICKWALPILFESHQSIILLSLHSLAHFEEEYEYKGENITKCDTLGEKRSIISSYE